MPRIPASVTFVILQRWTCDNLESCVHLLRKQEMKSCRQSLSNDLEVHSQVERCMKAQNTLCRLSKFFLLLFLVLVPKIDIKPKSGTRGGTP
ncbi:hypothetical protein NC651_020650 [Populus alba x Populus x berolinensis]|nr:hypothetical protein NC651_020650 [Populus alba x Populus x berolinensis]